jgi:hypothetical protein
MVIEYFKTSRFFLRWLQRASFSGKCSKRNVFLSFFLGFHIISVSFVNKRPFKKENHNIYLRRQRVFFLFFLIWLFIKSVWFFFKLLAKKMFYKHETHFEILRYKKIIICFWYYVIHDGIGFEFVLCGTELWYIFG